MIVFWYSLAVISVVAVVILCLGALIMVMSFLNDRHRFEEISMIDIERINVTGGSSYQYFVLDERGILVKIKSSLHEL